MSFSQLLTKTFWILPLVLQPAIAFAILKRNLLRTFPFFFSYTTAVVACDIVLLFLRYPSKIYALVYWYGEVVTVSLGVGAIFETMRQLCPPYPFLRVALKVVWAFGAAAAVAAILMLVLTHVGLDGDRVLLLIMLGERSVKFLEACWFILVSALVSHLGHSWQQYSVGIVAGFGVCSGLTLALFELHAHAHMVSDSTFVLLNSGAYNVAVVIWAYYFLQSWRGLASDPLPKANLSEWNKVAAEYYTRQWSRRY